MHSQFGECMYTAQGEFLCEKGSRPVEHFGEAGKCSTLSECIKGTQKPTVMSALNAACALKAEAEGKKHMIFNDKVKSSAIYTGVSNVFTSCGKESDFRQCIDKNSQVLNGLKATDTDCILSSGKRR